jgi:hypothetical protein
MPNEMSNNVHMFPLLLLILKGLDEVHDTREEALRINLLLHSQRPLLFCFHRLFLSDTFQCIDFARISPMMAQFHRSKCSLADYALGFQVGEGDLGKK